MTDLPDTPPLDAPANDAQQLVPDVAPLMRCYVLMGISIPVTFSPLHVMGGVGMLVMLASCIWAYRLRGRVSGGVLYKSHGTWMVRTLWITSFYMLLAMLLSGIVISGNADQSPLIALQDAIKAGSANPAEVTKAINDFMRINHDLMLGTTLSGFIPVALLLWARLFKGYRLADQFKPFENVKSWGLG